MNADDYYTQPDAGPMLISWEEVEKVITKRAWNLPLSPVEQTYYQYSQETGDRCHKCQTIVGVCLHGERDEYATFTDFWVLDEDFEVMLCDLCYEDIQPKEIEEEVAIDRSSV